MPSRFRQILRLLEALHISYNMGTSTLPDMYALGSAALGPLAYISGKALVPMS